MLKIKIGKKYQKFATKIWHAIDSQTTKNNYSKNSSIKFEIETIKSSLCDYSDAYTFVKGDMTVNSGKNTNVALRNIHDLQHVKHRSMTFLLMKPMMSISQCLCIIYLSTAIITQAYQEFCYSLKEMKCQFIILI